MGVPHSYPKLNAVWILFIIGLVYVLPVIDGFQATRIVSKQQHPQKMQVLKMEQRSLSSSSRRKLLSEFLVAGGAFVLSNKKAGAEEKKPRLKGAAELDLEYYIKDLMNGNDQTPSVQTVKVLKPARNIDANFARTLEDLTFTAIVQESGLSKDEVKNRIENLKGKVQDTFQKKAPFDADNISDQYRFDMNSYVQYKVAMMSIESLIRRINLVRYVGEGVLAALASRPNSSLQAFQVFDARKNGQLSTVLEQVEVLLSELQGTGFIKGYRVDAPEDLDEDWTAGFPVEVAITLEDPATLGAALQLPT